MCLHSHCDCLFQAPGITHIQNNAVFLYRIAEITESSWIAFGTLVIVGFFCHHSKKKNTRMLIQIQDLAQPGVKVFYQLRRQHIHKQPVHI